MGELVAAIFGGNPWALVTKLAIGAALLLAAFGGGYYVCDHMHAVAAAQVAQVAAKAQETHDVAMHANAVLVSNGVTAQDTAAATKLTDIVKSITIHDAPAPAACNLTQADADALNQAGAR